MAKQKRPRKNQPPAEPAPKPAAPSAAAPSKAKRPSAAKGQANSAASAIRSKRTLRKNTEAKLENLLATAAELIAQKGYDTMSIRDVARATGYSLAGMYYYFDSKEQLLFQIQSNTFHSLVAEQEAAASEGPPRQRLEALVRNYLDFFVRHTNELKVCAFEHESLKGEAYDEVRDIRHRWYRLLADIVAELTGLDPHADDVTVRHHTLFIFGMLNWLFMWFDERRDLPITRLADEMVNMILNGLPRPA